MTGSSGVRTKTMEKLHFDRILYFFDFSITFLLEVQSSYGCVYRREQAVGFTLFLDRSKNLFSSFCGGSLKIITFRLPKTKVFSWVYISGGSGIFPKSPFSTVGGSVASLNDSGVILGPILCLYDFLGCFRCKMCALVQIFMKISWILKGVCL